MSGDPAVASKSLDRYALFDELACGGMATVHLGRMRGAVGFTLTVAIKRLHPAYARDRGFVSMFVDEARLAARVRHPNVVPIFDVVANDGELFLVMEYVHGVTLADLLRLAGEQGSGLPPSVAAGILCGALEGLHAAHEAAGERGEPLGIVHRDVSPQNILVGADGIARVLDFGIAKAAGRLHASVEGVLKGKVGYMAPEQLSANVTSRLSDVYSAAIVLWEALAGRRLFTGDTVGGIVGQMLLGEIDPPSRHAPSVPAALDAVVLRATSPIAEARFASAREMAVAVERAIAVAPPSEISAWVKRLAGGVLAARAELVAGVERRTRAAELTVDSALAIASGGRESSPSRGPASGQDARGGWDTITELAGAKDVRSSVPDGDTPASPKGAGTTALSAAEVPRRRRWLVPAAAIAAAIAAAAGIFSLRASRTSSEAIARPVEIEAAAKTAFGATAPSGVATEAPPAVTAGSRAAPIPSASTATEIASAPSAPAPAPSSSTARPPPAATAKPAASAPKAKAPGRCDPPYVIDADGIRNPKPECL